MQKIYNSVDEMVGQTPLLQLNQLMKKCRSKAVLLGKCEAYNPVFSVKDRAAQRMLDEAEKSGEVTSETIFVEATSGNTGIALAALCAARGYKLVITMPENMTKERIMLMRHFGAEVILTPAADGMKGAIAKADLLAEKNPHVVQLRQFCNSANVDAHRFGTAMELLDQTGGAIDVLVSAVGTSGTLSGIAATLKTNNPDLYVVAVEPKSSAVLNGGDPGPHQIPGIGAGFIPPLYDDNLVNEVMDITNEEALNMARECASTEGLSIGLSAGAALCAAVKLSRREEFADCRIVVIFPDGIERYLSML